NDVVGTSKKNTTPIEIVRVLAVEARLSLKAVGVISTHPRDVSPELPLDACALLRTPRDCASTFLEGEEYIYFGFNDCISRAVCGRRTEDLEIPRIQPHINGATLFSSSRLPLWPIPERLAAL
ncbi:hypothetical protein EG68_11671, partial [Paragonimus skrjabini miyazakii]